jgi:hypothetical protein
VGERVLVAQVVDVSRGDEWKARLGGELRELRVDPLLLCEAGVLDLDIRPVAAEDLCEAIEVGGRVLRAALFERPGDAAGEATGEGDDALGARRSSSPSRPAACRYPSR